MNCAEPGLSVSRVGRGAAGLITGIVALLISTQSDIASAGNERQPLVVKEQGSFLYGGEIQIAENGEKIYYDHGYAQYQIPPHARRLPLIMWPGGGGSAKTWETTQDGREGFQNIFLRRGWSVYNIDQPRRGRAGRPREAITIPEATPTMAFFWNVFRPGVWQPPAAPTFFPGVQFPKDAASIDQYFQQFATNLGPYGFDNAAGRFFGESGAALLEKTGPAILLTHSRAGVMGWWTAIKSEQVRAIVAYEPANFTFPQSAPPADVPTSLPEQVPSSVPDNLVPDEDFNRLTRMPIQIVFGDNIATRPSGIYGVELWRYIVQRAEQFARAVNARGGDVEILYLPRAGLHGNTHFPFADLNNLAVADELSKYLAHKDLDRRGGRGRGDGR